VCHSRQAGGGVGGVLLLGSSLADVWRSLPHNSNKARAAAGVALLVMVALMHQLVSTGAAYSRPQVRPLSLSLSLSLPRCWSWSRSCTSWCPQAPPTLTPR
jgi:hypothetical protein